VNSRDAFVPPKPKEFDKAALIGMFFEEVKGMKASLNMGSGLVRLSVNGAAPCKGTQLFSHDCLEQKLITKLHVKKARTNVFYVEGI
jgi:hypothetical protein